MRSCKLMIRRQRSYSFVISFLCSCTKIDSCRFEELSHTNSVEALSYLQNDLSALVDHGNQAETDEVLYSIQVNFLENFCKKYSF